MGMGMGCRIWGAMGEGGRYSKLRWYPPLLIPGPDNNWSGHALTKPKTCHYSTWFQAASVGVDVCVSPKVCVMSDGATLPSLVFSLLLSIPSFLPIGVDAGVHISIHLFIFTLLSTTNKLEWYFFSCGCLLLQRRIDRQTWTKHQSTYIHIHTSVHTPTAWYKTNRRMKRVKTASLPHTTGILLRSVYSSSDPQCKYCFMSVRNPFRSNHTNNNRESYEVLTDRQLGNPA